MFQKKRKSVSQEEMGSMKRDFPYWAIDVAILISLSMHMKAHHKHDLRREIFCFLESVNPASFCWKGGNRQFGILQNVYCRENKRTWRFNFFKWKVSSTVYFPSVDHTWSRGIKRFVNFFSVSFSRLPLHGSRIINTDIYDGRVQWLYVSVFIYLKLNDLVASVVLTIWKMFNDCEECRYV